jgi:hypothetical protein
MEDWTLRQMTVIAVTKWQVMLSHTDHSNVRDQALCFVSLPYHFHSLASDGPSTAHQLWPSFRTPPFVNQSLSHIFIMFHPYIPTSQHPLAFTMVPKPGSFDTLATTHHVTQCHIHEDLNPQQHQCTNLTTHNLLSHYFMVTSDHRKRQCWGVITGYTTTEGHYIIFPQS